MKHQKARQKQLNKNYINKPIFTLSLVAAALFASQGAFANYVEQGKVGDKVSWETKEYQADWGLAAMKASSAYALGFHGQNAKVAVMDSGALLSHPDLDSDRIHAVKASGEYGSTGMRYPQIKDGHYEKGQKFDVDGDWIAGVNDSHGTHVTGTVGANRDGNEMHGVAWGADVFSGNTGGTDSSNYGPYHDYQYFYTGWKAIVDTGAQVINNSWGTNPRIIFDKKSVKPAVGADGKVLKNSNGKTIYVPGKDGFETKEHMPVDTTAQTEYEYYYFKKVYGNAPSFVDAAYDAVKNTGVVQVITTGNRDFAQPYYRPLYPYFNPEAEKHWVAVAGLQRELDSAKNPTGNYELVTRFNEAGNAKWWTVVAPGIDIYSSKVGLGTEKDPKELGSAYWTNSSGTSMSAPHVTGAMGVLLSRYQDMDGTQVRDVMFTTANHTNTDGSDFKDWTAAEGVPDERYGWGVPDLEKGMFGPGQFLGQFTYTMATTPLDVWSNDITQNALEAREKEDLAWLAAYKEKGIEAGGDYELGDNFVINDGDDDDTNHIIVLEDAKKWRAEYYAKRAAAIEAKIDAGEYQGSLVKQGAGTLVMTGNNTYAGGTTVKDGALYGFTESFGNGTVNVDGGQFGIINTYNDEFTQQGVLTSKDAPSANMMARTAVAALAGQKANIAVNNGGTLVVAADDAVNVGKLTFAKGAKVTVGSDNPDMLHDIYQSGKTVAGSLNAEQLDGVNNIENSDLAFFDTRNEQQGNTLTSSIARNDKASVADYANNSNGRAIGHAIKQDANNTLFGSLIGATKDEVENTLNSLGNDAYLNANNASIVNAMAMTRAVKDQVMGVGNGRSAEFDGQTARIWINGFGNWSNVDYGQSDMDVDFYAGLLGAEVDITEGTTAGLFFGTGSTKFKAGNDGKIDSDDIHFGVYGLSDIAQVVSLNYGVIHTHQDRDAERTLTVGNQSQHNAVSGDADITQVFAEAAYTNWHTTAYSVEPYLGFSWIHVKNDGFSENVGDMTFTTDNDKQNLEVATIGLRGDVPFTLGGMNMAVKGHLSGTHFFGDNRSEAAIYLDNAGVATIEGGKLDNLLGVGVGVEAELAKSAKASLSYTGAFDGDMNSNGINVNVRLSF